ncbi:sialic acid-binding Ig-like lectin 5 [Chanodichthys erythropterus]|uniref:sialic acid-binding Ig-like lectin 5 n=1 Tax=Chanodichthys erythropterus TaxID=933992 RepID=UPI00351EA2CD
MLLVVRAGSRTCRRYMQGCRECAMSKSPRHLPAGKLLPLPIPNRPWSHLGVDFITDLPASDGNTCILVIIDCFSKSCCLIPLRGLPTAMETAEMLFNHLFHYFGIPEDIVSDRGPQFISRVWKAFHSLLGVAVSLTSGYHPQSNGQTERKIQEIGRFLRTFCHDHQDSRNKLFGLGRVRPELSPAVDYRTHPTPVRPDLTPAEPPFHSSWKTVQHTRSVRSWTPNVVVVSWSTWSIGKVTALRNAPGFQETTSLFPTYFKLSMTVTLIDRHRGEEDDHHGVGVLGPQEPSGYWVSSAGWGVSYSPSHICALKNSSVIMNCTYAYPTGYQIEKVFWTKGPVQEGVELLDLSNDPEYSQRLQYLGDKQQICTMRLSHVTLKDSCMYYFRFITNKDNMKWTGVPGVTLTVTDLQVESPERVTERDSVRLTCKSSCTLTDRATFIWYRNSQPLTERRDRNNELLLQSVRREDAGRYSCAVHGHNHISPAVQLSVMYPPKSISVSISPSGEIVSGDSVTLICSSDSNPPAEISWFRGRTFVGSGRIYSISKISSDDSGEYKCKSKNQHGEKYSDAVTLNIMYPPRNVSVLITGSGEIVSGDSVTLICSSDSNPPALNFSWFKENESSAVGSGQSFSALQSGRFYCQAHNQHGSQRSDAVTVTVHHGAGMNVIVIAATSGGLFFIIIIIIIFIIKKRKSDKTEDLTVKQNDLYSDASQRVSVHDEPLSEPYSVNDAPYASVKPKRFRGNTPESRETEEIQYATVQYHRKKKMKRSEESECQYDNIRVHQPDAAVRQSVVETVEDASVIYSSVK